MRCDICDDEIPEGKWGRGYGAIVCSDECFKEAGKTYKASTDRNRGGGVGKNKVTI